jgi:hypothetical protein
MKRYETFIKILNKCVYLSKPKPNDDDDTIILSDEEYVSCDNIQVFEPTISSKCMKPIDYIRKTLTQTANNKAKNKKYLNEIQPELNKLSKRFTNANSESISNFSRLINGMKPLMELDIIKIINGWLCANDPRSASMMGLFDDMTEYFKTKENVKYIDHFNNLIKFIKVIVKYSKYRQLIHQKIFNIIDIIMSYSIYCNMSIKYNIIYDFETIINQLLDILREGGIFNIFLNGLKLGDSLLRNIHSNNILFIKISGNIYLRDNNLYGIPQNMIIDTILGKKTVCSYKLLDITGNENINFHLAESDGVKLANIDFFRTNLALIESHNPEFMSCMSGIFDSLGYHL